MLYHDYINQKYNNPDFYSLMLKGSLVEVSSGSLICDETGVVVELGQCSTLEWRLP